MSVAASSIAALSVAVVPATAVSASAVSTAALASPTASTATTAPALVSATSPVLKKSRMDVDGDGKRDSTTLSRTGTVARGYTYTITVRTARGAKASKAFRVEDGGENASYVWEGLTGIDGVRGAEIVVNTSPVGDGVPLTVFTWRKGKLVEQLRPGGSSKRAGSNVWMLCNMPWQISGYTFFTDRTGRHVTEHLLKPTRAKGKVSGTHTTYTWSTKRNAWVKSSTRASGVISDATAQKKYAGIFGVRFS